MESSSLDYKTYNGPKHRRFDSYSGLHTKVIGFPNYTTNNHIEVTNTSNLRVYENNPIAGNNALPDANNQWIFKDGHTSLRWVHNFLSNKTFCNLESNVEIQDDDAAWSV